jgi:hypothetical protein
MGTPALRSQDQEPHGHGENDEEQQLLHCAHGGGSFPDENGRTGRA